MHAYIPQCEGCKNVLYRSRSNGTNKKGSHSPSTNTITHGETPGGTQHYNLRRDTERPPNSTHKTKCLSNEGVPPGHHQSGKHTHASARLWENAFSQRRHSFKCTSVTRWLRTWPSMPACRTHSTTDAFRLFKNLVSKKTRRDHQPQGSKSNSSWTPARADHRTSHIYSLSDIHPTTASRMSNTRARLDRAGRPRERKT